MLRGRGQKTTARIALWLSAVALTVGAESAAGRSALKSDETKGKAAAPNQEDHADYFSESRKDISSADLQKADKLRRKTITSIQDLLQGKKKSIRRFELLLRLGELHVERHDYLRDVEMGAYAKTWDAWAQGGKKGQEPKLDTLGSEAEMTKGANAFRKLVGEFPKHPRTDAALYSLGKTLARMGKDTAIDYYKQLIKSFPKSPLLPDTYLSLGEWYFDKHNIPEALANYKKVLDFKQHRAYPYAVYKLGWAYYNASAKNEQEVKDNYKKAVTAFKLVVKLADKEKQAGGPKRNLDLREEAIRDLIMVWADAEDVASAWKYFKTIGEQASFYTMLERLGNIYAEQGKNQQSIAVFQRLLKDSPKRENNPAVHAKLLELYDLTNNIPAVVAELRDMHKLYLGQAVWVQANQSKPGAVDEAKRLVELNTHRYGAIFHQRGQKAKSDSYMKHAASVYALYLEAFADSPSAYDIRYYLAEILFDFKQYEPAAQHYMTVAKADPKGKYMKPAAVNAVAAMNQVVVNGKWGALPPPGQVPKPLDIPSAKKRLVETIDQYVTLLPKDKEGEPMRFTAAQIFFDYGHYPEAMARFEKITKEIPETKQAKAAVKVVLGFYGDKEDWNKLIAWSQTFSKQERLLDAEMKKYVTDLLRAAMFKRALAYEKAKDHERAATSFIEYQKEFPTDQSADRALYNAMLNYFKVARVENAIAVGNTLLEKYPKSQLVPDVLADVGTTHESLARFDQAAQLFKRLALAFPNDKRSAAALFNAAMLYKGLKNLDESITLFRAFGDKYPQHQLGAEAQLELAQLLERKSRFPEAIQAYATYARRFPQDVEQALAAEAKVATLKLFHESRDQGQRDLDKLRKTLAAKDAPVAYEARSTVAQALFKMAEAGFGEYMAVKISDGRKIEQEVTAKQGKLERLASSYEAIIDLKSAEYTVAALYRLGEAHENFANALFNAPGPKGASQAEIDKLKTELEKVAFPLRDEAYKFFETAYKRSREVETFTTWTRRTYQKMVELAPEKHPEVDEMSAEPAYLSHELKMSKPVAELVGEEE